MLHSLMAPGKQGPADILQEGTLRIYVKLPVFPEERPLDLYGKYAYCTRKNVDFLDILKLLMVPDRRNLKTPWRNLKTPQGDF